MKHLWSTGFKTNVDSCRSLEINLIVFSLWLTRAGAGKVLWGSAWWVFLKVPAGQIPSLPSNSNRFNISISVISNYELIRIINITCSSLLLSEHSFRGI